MGVAPRGSPRSHEEREAPLLHRISRSVDGFPLGFDVHQIDTAARSDRSVVLLHGWPGDRTDYRDVVKGITEAATVVIPDLRGFGDSDRHRVDPAEGYSAFAQARSVAALIEELGLHRPVVAGYDIGSRTAQTLAVEHPGVVGALALSPPLPGAGARVLDVRAELWYIDFHRSGLAADVLDGDQSRIERYLSYFWDRWSAPGFRLDTGALDRLVHAYSRPGAFTGSIAWYQAGPGFVPAALGALWAPPRPSPRTGSRSLPRCSGRNSARSSRAPGRTGSRTSSPTSTWLLPMAPATSHRSKRPRGSRRWWTAPADQPSAAHRARTSSNLEGVPSPSVAIFPDRPSEVRRLALLDIAPAPAMFLWTPSSHRRLA